MKDMPSFASFVLSAALLSLHGTVWAICDDEINALNSMRDALGMRNSVSDGRYHADINGRGFRNDSSAELARLLASKQNFVSTNNGATNGGVRISVAQQRLDICLIKDAQKKIAINSVENAASPSRQPQQNTSQALQNQVDGKNASTSEGDDCAAYAEPKVPTPANVVMDNIRACLNRVAAKGKQTNVETNSLNAQQQAQQAQDAARVAQTRADQARQGKRKTHDPEAEAHECIEIDKNPGLFGAFKNTCGYKVNFSTCNYRPRVRQGGFNWSADFDCEQQKFGLHTPDGGRAVASHNRNTEMVHWFACKAPAFPVDTEFVAGSGVRGRCN